MPLTAAGRAALTFGAVLVVDFAADEEQTYAQGAFGYRTTVF